MKLDELRIQLRAEAPAKEMCITCSRRPIATDIDDALLCVECRDRVLGKREAFDSESFDMLIIDDPLAPTTAEDRERLKRWVSGSSIMSAKIDMTELRERLLRSDEELRKRDGYVDCSVCKRPDFVPDAPEEPYVYTCRSCFEKARRP
jgi:hypothetical protein